MSSIQCSFFRGREGDSKLFVNSFHFVYNFSRNAPVLEQALTSKNIAFFSSCNLIGFHCLRKLGNISHTVIQLPWKQEETFFLMTFCCGVASAQLNVETKSVHFRFLSLANVRSGLFDYYSGYVILYESFHSARPKFIIFNLG